MGGYTKGAWMLLPSIPEEGVECFWLKAQPGGGICRGFSQDIASINGPQSGEQLANARLIASAPDLLEALHEGRRAIGDHNAPNDCYATGPLTGDAYRDLVECPACRFIAMYDAAISRATGEGQA